MDSFTSTEQGRCAECGKSLPKSDMLQFGGVWICAECKPVFVQRLQEGGSPAGSGYWRSGKQLVTLKGATLPARCVKCNQAVSDPPKTVNLFWHPPLIYLTILLSLLIYIVIAAIAGKRAKISYCLCEEHRRARRNAIITGWGGVAGSILCFVLAGTTDNGGLFILLGFAVLLGALIYSLVRARAIYAKRINKENVWLGGICPEFLAELPEWTGKP